MNTTLIVSAVIIGGAVFYVYKTKQQKEKQVHLVPRQSRPMPHRTLGRNTNSTHQYKSKLHSTRTKHSHIPPIFLKKYFHH